MSRNSIIILPLAALLVAACGQPGPLYLPREEIPGQTQADKETGKQKPGPDEHAEPITEPQSEQYYPY
ncbi:MAG: LPS translocon maturation chaperone LptM [Gammaproteobacteria bacterium]